MKKNSGKIGIILLLVIIAIISVILVLYLNKDNMQTTDSNKDNSSEISDDITDKATEVYKKYLDISMYKNSNIGPMPNLLILLGLETEENINNLTSNDAGELIKTNVLYCDFKNEMLKYITEELFNKEYSDYANIENYVGICNVGAGLVSQELESLTLISQKDNKYIYKANIKDVELYEHYLENEEGLKETDCFYNIEVTFTKENGNIVVAEEK